MQPKDFLYFITDQVGKSLRKNNGIVEAVATPTPIPQTPDGWQEKSIRFTRNTKLFGVFRSFTTPLKFVRNAGTILRDQLIKFGTEVKLYLLIYILDKSFGGGWVHRLLYKGEIDLTQIVSDENFVTVNIMEGDLIKFIKANENTTYEIPLGQELMKADGIPLRFTAKWGTINEDLFTASMGSLESYFSQMTMFPIPGENRSLYLTQFDVFADKITDFSTSDLNFAQSLTATSYRFKFNLTVRITQDNDCRDTSAKLQLRDQDANVLKEFWVLDPPDGSFDQTYNLVIDETIAIGSQKNMFLGFELNCRRQLIGSGEAVIVASIKESTIQVDYTQAKEASFVPFIRPLRLLQAILNKMTESENYVVESTLFSEDWYNLVVTSGNAARGIPNSPVKLSWNDVLDSYNVPCNITMLIKGNKVIIEAKQKAFLPTVTANLGEVNDFSWKIPAELLFSSFKIGYPEFDYEDVNGKYEFNVTQTRVTPVKKVNKTFELLSKIRGDSYGFEFARIEGAGKDTTDLKSDNDSFFLHIEKNPSGGGVGEPVQYYLPLRLPYTSVTGILEPTRVFNMEISPMRCLERHGSFLRSIFYWQTDKWITFSSAGKDAALKTIDATGRVVEERANVFIGNLGNPYFIPIEFKCESKINRTLLNAIVASDFGTVQFSTDGISFYGFPMDIGIQPATNASQDTVLLCSPQSDITKLIR